MPKRKHSLDDLHTFTLVAEHGSLSAAAEVLGVPPSTVSRRVSRLEDDLGTALLHREHRKVGLTADGEALWKRCRPALRDLDDATRRLEVEDAEVQGRLRLTAAAGFAVRPGVAEMLADFCARYPGVELDLRVGNRVFDLVEEGVDVAIRPYTPKTAMRDADLHLRRFASNPFGLFAAPDYPDLTPDTVRAHLIGHSILGMAPAVGRHFPGWNALRGAEPRVTTNDFDTMVALAAAGLGVATCPELIARTHLDAGTLVPVLSELDLGRSDICLMWPSSRHLAPRLRAFIDHIVEWTPRLGMAPPTQGPPL